MDTQASERPGVAEASGDGSLGGNRGQLVATEGMEGAGCGPAGVGPSRTCSYAIPWMGVREGR